jgi:hypothetical protein
MYIPYYVVYSRYIHIQYEYTMFTNWNIDTRQANMAVNYIVRWLFGTQVPDGLILPYFPGPRYITVLYGRHPNADCILGYSNLSNLMGFNSQKMYKKTLIRRYKVNDLLF